MATITPIEDADLISASNEVINTNFTNLNTDKIETSVIDTDGTLAANSDAKLPSQQAVKEYVDNAIDARTILSTVSSVTPTLNTDDYKQLLLTAQNRDITSMTTNLSGTPANGDTLGVKITSGVGTMEFVAHSDASDASSDELIVSKPAGTLDGDILFAVATSVTSILDTAPDGWTSIGTADIGSTNRRELLYKVADGEPADYTFLWASAQGCRVDMVSYRGGFNLSDPIDVVSNTSYVVSNTTNRAASMVVAQPNSPLIMFAGVYDTAERTHTAPASPSGFAEDVDTGDTTGDFWTAIYSQTWTGMGATGDMDATISSSETAKHSFAVALNPNLAVTWGAKFQANQTHDNQLPTTIYPNETRDVKFEYSSALTKWVTAGNTADRQVGFSHRSGVTTYDVSTASGTQTIAHGLGRTPIKVSIKTLLGGSGGLSSHGFGVFDENQKVMHLWQTGTSTAVVTSSNAYGVKVSTTTGDTAMATGVISVDATNITITWTKTGSPTGTATILWEVE